MRDLNQWNTEGMGLVLSPQFWDHLDRLHLPHHHTGRKAAPKMAQVHLFADRILLIAQGEAID